MDKKRIIIVGGGISGLSASWFLSKDTDEYEIILLEKSSHGGGWMQTRSEGGFLFEKGPRIFKASRSKDVLDLVQDLGLKEEIITSSDEVKNRYIWWRNELHKVPSGPFSFLFSPLTRPLLVSLASEWRRPPLAAYDESIYDFVKRRFNKETAERIFDPIIMGIYTGDIRKLSVRSCLPFLKHYEENYGSVTRGFLQSRKKSKEMLPFGINSKALFSLKKGTSGLLSALLEKTRAKVFYGQEVHKITFLKNEAVIHTQDKKWHADFVFCALPVREAESLFRQIDGEVAEVLEKIPTESITGVSIGFRKDVLKYKGFGYLVPSTEKLSILGAVFDSVIFPHQNKSSSETRITANFRGVDDSEEEIFLKTEQVLRKHLQIEARPDFLSVQRSPHSLPQFLVGHGERIAFLEKKMKSERKRCYLIGNYLTGVSVNDCIACSKRKIADFLLSERY